MKPYYEDDLVELHYGDCLDVLRSLPDCSVDAVVTDPPYGLEFMGKAWDSFSGDAWRESAGITRTGYGDAERLPRPSFGGGDSANPTCATCGGRKRGARKCSCAEPDWRVKGKPLSERDNNAAQMRAFGDWCELWATECLRVLKPGGHMLAFGGSRTWHRLACAVEDAGFEVRDSIAWLYGSGFPKSLDVSKAIDKAAGAERPVIGPYPEAARKPNGSASSHSVGLSDRPGHEMMVTGPATPDAERWNGWGTALKPAFEPIVVGRKPLAGTVAANVTEHGTGALNIDACRTPGSWTTWTRKDGSIAEGGTMAHSDQEHERNPEHPGGRWPTNVALTDDQADELDRQTGVLTSGGTPPRRGADTGTRSAYGTFAGQDETEGIGGSQGGASRFFPTFRYEAKAPTDQRPKVDGVAHPTVKPLDLMRWLVRLVTPPGGVVLEPFAGSGTTAEACVIEGFRCIAIEREATYLPLIVARLSKPIQPVMFGESA